MIRGLHGMIFSSDAAASRAFMRDALRLPFTDVGGGWLIFDLAEADVGFHPVDPERGTKPGSHDVSFYCDNITGTMADLKKRGVVFKHDPIDQGYGLVTYFEIPGGIEVQLYEPRYLKRSVKLAKAKPAAKKAAKKPAKKAVKKGKARPRVAAKRKASKRKASKR